MRIKNKYLSASFKLLACLSGVTGILLQCGVFSGKPDFSVLNYFTLMSNVFCVLYVGAAAVYVLRTGNTLLPRAKGVLLLCISVTGLVYHMMLAGKFEMQGTLFWSNFLLHTVMPVMTVMDWLLFDEKGHFSYKDPLLWLVAPLAYFVYVQIRVNQGAILGPYGSRYPYFFMDPEALGWGTVFLINLGMLVGFLLLSELLVWLDHCLARRTKAKT